MPANLSKAADPAQRPTSMQLHDKCRASSEARSPGPKTFKASDIVSNKKRVLILCTVRNEAVQHSAIMMAPPALGSEDWSLVVTCPGPYPEVSG